MNKNVVLVTGASGGIGAAVTRALAERGAKVAAVDLDGTRLAEQATAMTAEGLAVEAFPADVAEPSAVESVVDGVERTVGPIDHLVNAAGILRLREIKDLTAEDWNATWAVNATGVFAVSRAVVNRMVPRATGTIVTVASNAASTARADMGAYAASKAAAAMFTKCLGLEVARYGIRCNVVAPGSTDTPMLRSMWHNEAGPEATLTGSLDSYRVGIPLRKLARPADVAAAVGFLLSDEAGHITMQTLTVDGGATLGV